MFQPPSLPLRPSRGKKFYYVEQTGQHEGVETLDLKGMNSKAIHIRTILKKNVTLRKDWLGPLLALILTIDPRFFFGQLCGLQPAVPYPRESHDFLQSRITNLCTYRRGARTDWSNLTGWFITIMPHV
jgi:hypothetical protein